MLSRKEKEMMQRRELIQNTAMKLFYKNGFGKTTMDEIAAVAEFSKTTLYSYFKSKEELFFSLYIEALRERVKIIEKAAGMQSTGREKLLYVGESLFKFFSKKPQHLKLQLYWSSIGIDLKKVSEETRKLFNGINSSGWDKLRGIFHQGRDDGTINSDIDIDMIMSYFAYTIRAIMKQSIISTHQFTKFEGKEYFQNYLKFFLDALK